MVKAGTILIVGGLGVLAVIAYLIYRNVKGLTNTVGAPFAAIGQGFGNVIVALDGGANALATWANGGITGVYDAGYNLGNALGTHGSGLSAQQIADFAATSQQKSLTELKANVNQSLDQKLREAALGIRAGF